MVREKDFRDAVIAHSQKYDVRVVLLDPDCDEANRRAQIEEPLGRSTIEDIRSTIGWLRNQQADNKRFRVHLYTLPPMLALVLTNQFVFVEPYHFGRPEGREGCIGGHVPMLKIRNQPEREACNPYDFFKSHFDYMWVHTHGLRVNLLIAIVDCKSSRYVTLENQMPGDLKMDDWKLSGQGSKKPFLFSRDYVWKKGTRIAIGRGSEGQTRADRHFECDVDFMGNNNFLTLANKAGTVVWERGLAFASEIPTSSA
jgi:hypothetical protein